MIGADLRDRITTSLSEIEREERVRILYACESGSRAWGFASRDSDYDVRFVYLREREWYVRVDQADVRRTHSTIERPGNPLDVSGWDLQKTLWLAYKSNPSLLEWLHSPIVYRTSPEVDELRRRAVECSSPQRCLLHYLSMAERNARACRESERPSAKKYLYVLRPVLACRWIEAGKGVVPMEHTRLTESVLPDRDGLRELVSTLVRCKAAGLEPDTGPRIQVLDAFLDGELERLEVAARTLVGSEADIEPLNAFFRRVAGF